MRAFGSAGIVGPDFQRGFEMGDRLFGTVLSVMDIAKAGMSFRHVRFQQQRLLMMGQRFLPLPEVLQRQSGNVVRLGIIRFAISFWARSYRRHFPYGHRTA